MFNKAEGAYLRSRYLARSAITPKARHKVVPVGCELDGNYERVEPGASWSLGLGNLRNSTTQK